MYTTTARIVVKRAVSTEYIPLVLGTFTSVEMTHRATSIQAIAEANENPVTRALRDWSVTDVTTADI
jgi:hypothetical protein